MAIEEEWESAEDIHRSSDSEDELLEGGDIDVDEIFREVRGDIASDDGSDDQDGAAGLFPQGESITLESLLENVPELAEQNTLEQEVAVTTERTKARKTLIAPERATVGKDWRVTSAKDSILLQWITHLSHIARKGLGSLETEFQRAFCALHQLYLISAQVPLPALMSEHRPDTDEKPNVDEEASDEGALPSQSREKDDAVTRYRQLNKIITIAFRCASVKIARIMPVEGFAKVFTPDYDSSDSEVQRIFTQLARVDTGAKLSAMKRAGEEILRILQQRMGDDVAKAKIYDDILYSVRKFIISSRVSRSTSKAMRKARVDIH